MSADDYFSPLTRALGASTPSFVLKPGLRWGAKDGDRAVAILALCFALISRAGGLFQIPACLRWLARSWRLVLQG